MNFAVPVLVAVVIASSISNSFSVQNENPGIRSRVTKRGFHYADKLGVAMLINRLRQDGLDDINVKQEGLEYSIYNIRTSRVSIKSSSLKASPGVGVVLETSGVDLGFYGNLKYKTKVWGIYVKDTVSFTLNARGIGFSLTARLSADSSGRPMISTGEDDCKAWVDDIDIHFSGGASLLYNLFTGYIEKKLELKLEELICLEGRRLVNGNAARRLITFTGP